MFSFVTGNRWGRCYLKDLMIDFLFLNPGIGPVKDFQIFLAQQFFSDTY